MEALHPDDFSFDRKVPPVKLTKYDVDDTGLSTRNVQQLLSTSYLVVGDERSNIARDVVGFLLGRQSGDAEDSLHARDDCLFNVRLICMLASLHRL